ncbi:hypothetical protein [Micromonospora globbae]
MRLAGRLEIELPANLMIDGVGVGERVSGRGTASAVAGRRVQ